MEVRTERVHCVDDVCDCGQQSGLQAFYVFHPFTGWQDCKGQDISGEPVYE
jgi:hypothetical protein